MPISWRGRIVPHDHRTNIEVVVNVHAAGTTTSEAKQARYYYGFQAKVNNSLRLRPLQTACVRVFKYNCPNLPATLVEEGIRG